MITDEDMLRKIDRLQRQCDELLAACKAYIADYENPLLTCHNGHTAEKARAAIAAVEDRHD